MEVIEEEGSKFRTVTPASIIGWIKAMQARTWEADTDDTLWIDPPK
ncbi:MAG: hypothetical protein GY788_23265 [bacterium]|nr:hypothetical protein [bacterium]